jgi:hypothetical protein
MKQQGAGWLTAGALVVLLSSNDLTVSAVTLVVFALAAWAWVRWSTR